MQNILSVVEEKVDTKHNNHERIASIVSRFIEEKLEPGTQLVDVSYLQGYYTNFVYKIVFSFQESQSVFYLKLGWLPEDGSLRFYERIRLEYEKTLDIYELFKEDQVLHTINPIAYYPEFGGFLTVEMTGQRLDHYLLELMKAGSLQEDKYEAFILSGKWLSEYQSRSQCKERESFSKDELKERVVNKLELVRKFQQGTVSKNDLRILTDKALLLVDKLGDDDLKVKVKHNDFAPWNVLCSDNDVTIFDFADCGVDLTLHDYFNFMRALESFKGKFRANAAVIDKAEAAFTKGYLSGGKPGENIERFMNYMVNVEQLRINVHSRSRCSGLVGALKRVVFARRIGKLVRRLKNIS